MNPLSLKYEATSASRPIWGTSSGELTNTGYTRPLSAAGNSCRRSDKGGDPRVEQPPDVKAQRHKRSGNPKAVGVFIRHFETLFRPIQSNFWTSEDPQAKTECKNSALIIFLRPEMIFHIQS
jgi:hypothetical protein